MGFENWKKSPNKTVIQLYSRVINLITTKENLI
jgi:hypothetical protein